jgi:hypothetical protein
MKVNATEKVKFKGIYQPMCLYDVHGIGGHYQVSLQNKDRKPLKKLNPPLKIECFQVEGKTEIAEPIAGKIEYIGENVAEISLASQIEAYKNLKIVYSTGQQSRLSELYAKVVPEGKYSMKVSGKNLLIEFTSFADEIKNFMNELGDIDL